MKIITKNEERSMDFRYKVLCTIKDGNTAAGFLLGDNEEQKIDNANYRYVIGVDYPHMVELVRNGDVSCFGYDESSKEIVVYYGDEYVTLGEFMKSDFTIDKRLYDLCIPKQDGTSSLVGTVTMVLKVPNLGECMYVNMYGDMAKIRALLHEWQRDRVFSLLVGQCKVHENNANIVIPLKLFGKLIGDADILFDLSICNRDMSRYEKTLTRTYRKLLVPSSKLPQLLASVERHNKKVLLDQGIFMDL